jgi:hypothetical protein
MKKKKIEANLEMIVPRPKHAVNFKPKRIKKVKI